MHQQQLTAGMSLGMFQKKLLSSSFLLSSSLRLKEMNGIHSGEHRQCNSSVLLHPRTPFCSFLSWLKTDQLSFYWYHFLRKGNPCFHCPSKAVRRHLAPLQVLQACIPQHRHTHTHQCSFPPRISTLKTSWADSSTFPKSEQSYHSIFFRKSWAHKIAITSKGVGVRMAIEWDKQMTVQNILVTKD